MTINEPIRVVTAATMCYKSGQCGYSVETSIH